MISYRCLSASFYDANRRSYRVQIDVTEPEDHICADTLRMINHQIRPYGVKLEIKEQVASIHVISIIDLKSQRSTDIQVTSLLPAPVRHIAEVYRYAHRFYLLWMEQRNALGATLHCIDLNSFSHTHEWLGIELLSTRQAEGQLQFFQLGSAYVHYVHYTSGLVVAASKKEYWTHLQSRKWISVPAAAQEEGGRRFFCCCIIRMNDRCEFFFHVVFRYDPAAPQHEPTVDIQIYDVDDNMAPLKRFTFPNALHRYGRELELYPCEHYELIFDGEELLFVPTGLHVSLSHLHRLDFS